MIEVLTQYRKVVYVIKSCQTPEQKENALRWAEGWAKRMHSKYPKTITSWIDLFDSVTYDVLEAINSKNI